jgi:hypothetical protein
VGDYTYSKRQDWAMARMMLHAHRLCLPMTKEHLDVTAPDPFVPEVDPRWAPKTTFITIDDWMLKENVEPVPIDLTRLKVS